MRDSRQRRAQQTQWPSQKEGQVANHDHTSGSEGGDYPFGDFSEELANAKEQGKQTTNNRFWQGFYGDDEKVEAQTTETTELTDESKGVPQVLAGKGETTAQELADLAKALNKS